MNLLSLKIIEEVRDEALYFEVYILSGDNSCQKFLQCPSSFNCDRSASSLFLISLNLYVPHRISILLMMCHYLGE